jgi:putative membrane protein
MNKLHRIVTASLAAAAMTSSYAQTLSKGDQHILAQLAQANMAEVAAGKIALEKASSQEVKTFAQQMVDDHTKGLQAVQDVARSKNVTLPTEPDARHKKMADKLNGLSGAAFDKAYLANAGVRDHNEAHKLVADAQKKASDPDVKALAAKLQPTVDQHLQTVQAMAAPGTSKH